MLLLYTISNSAKALASIFKIHKRILKTKEDKSKTHHIPFTTIFKLLTNKAHHVFLLLDQVLKLKN
jgi:hypothetical protein